MQTLVYIWLLIPRLFDWFWKRPIEVYTFLVPLVVIMTLRFSGLCVDMPIPDTVEGMIISIGRTFFASSLVSMVLYMFLFLAAVGLIPYKRGDGYIERYSRYQKDEALYSFMSWKDVTMLHVDAVWCLVSIFFWDLPRWVVRRVTKSLVAI